MSFHLVRIARPHTTGDSAPGDVISTFTFMANVAAQETAGDAAVSTSPQRVYERLAGTRELDAILYAVTDSPVADQGLGHDEIGAVILPAEGEGPDAELVGFLYIGLPLLEDRDVAELECVLDVDYLPLPGERPSLATRELAHWLVEQGVRACTAHGRSRVVAGVQSADQDFAADSFAHAFDVHGFVLKNTEAQLRVPLDSLRGVAAGRSGASAATPMVCNALSWQGPDLGEHTEAALALLRVAEADTHTGDLLADDVAWDRQRLAEVRAATLRTGLFAGGRLVGLAEIARQPGADPRMAELTCVVIDRDFRGQGLSYVLLRELGKAAMEHWPDVADLYTTLSVGDEVARRLADGVGAQVLSYAQTLERRVDA